MSTENEDLIASGDMVDSEPELLEDLNCPLCRKVLTSPRRLPCLHSFCHDCLEAHITNVVSIKDSVKELCCPLCRSVACSREFSTSKLVHIFPLDTILLSVLIKLGSKVKVDLLCNVCQAQDVTSPAVDLCTVCEEALCIQCSKMHVSSRLSSAHIILEIQDLPSKQETILQNSHIFHCTKHEYFPVELYCKGHETQLCARCFVDDHAKCSEVIKLADETPNLSEALTQTKEQMKELEEQLKMFANINESNLSKLESDVNHLTIEIRILKNTINGALDDLEKKVREEGDRIFSEEKKRIEQLDNCHQSQITAIRNSNVAMESASKYATQTQMLLHTKKISNQLSLTKQYIDDNYLTNDILTLELEVNSQLKSVTKIPRGELGRVKMKRNKETLLVPEGFKPLKECMAILLNVTEIKGLNNKTPWYAKAIYTSNKQLLVTDFSNNIFYILDSSYDIVGSHKFPDSPFDLCMVDEEVVVTTLPHEKSIHFLSIKDKVITYKTQIQTKYLCYSITTFNHEELIVSGPCDDDNMYYWSIITLEGKEKSYHKFKGKGNNQTYVALNASKTRLYISVYKDNSLHCFGLDGMKQFTFTHQSLKGPQGVSVDRDDNVYLVGSQSHNIIKICSDGFLFQVIVNGIEKTPMGLCFNQDGDTFALTHVTDTALSFYRLDYKDK
ncbi:hypothetical protein CHS0354_036239 [Potamilus streckersoni]|uniref:Uncharacterized protein n=1 Tax=Potamilus streckersoni TaxID=2493646 RepID=A0AAE0SVH3_9BIVA|nr:hypothetical protein CHS0354_036239 [Potamilus streckersoni]